jgi:hypothetical protein
VQLTQSLQLVDQGKSEVDSAGCRSSYGPGMLFPLAFLPCPQMASAALPPPPPSLSESHRTLSLAVSTDRGKVVCKKLVMVERALVLNSHR